MTHCKRMIVLVLLLALPLWLACGRQPQPAEAVEQLRETAPAATALRRRTKTANP